MSCSRSSRSPRSDVESRTRVGGLTPGIDGMRCAVDPLWTASRVSTLVWSYSRSTLCFADRGRRGGAVGSEISGYLTSNACTRHGSHFFQVDFRPSRPPANMSGFEIAGIALAIPSALHLIHRTVLSIKDVRCSLAPAQS